MDPVTQTPPARLSTYTPQTDSSKYIRTYAKDVAAVTNTPIPTVSDTGKPAQEDSAREAGKLGVALPEYDSSPVNHSGEGVSPKEFKQEVVALSEDDSKDIFKGKDVPAATPLMPQASIGIAQSVAPTGSILEAQAETKTAEQERESILARLRSKVATAPAVTMPEPAVPAPTAEPIPVSTPSHEVPLRAAAPTFPDLPASFPPIPPTPQPVPTPAPVAPATPESPSPLHTYSTDFADRIDTQQSSTFAVLAAQSDAGQSVRETPKRKRNFVPLFAGAAMVLVGIGAISGAYFYVEKETAVPTALNIPSLVTYDEAVEVTGTGPALVDSIAEVASGEGVAGNVVVTYITDAPATSTLSGIPQPGAILIRRLGVGAPDILIRNIQDMSTVGVITAGSESHPFFVLKVNSYERTFAGMLAWEQSMAQTLNAFYPDYPPAPVQTISTTSSSTPVFLTTQADPTAFVDAIVANYDVRVLRDASGRSRILYGYVGKDILVIARDEAAFSALLPRIRTTQN